MSWRGSSGYVNAVDGFIARWERRGVAGINHPGVKFGWRRLTLP